MRLIVAISVLAILPLGAVHAQDSGFNLQQFHPQPAQRTGGLSVLGGQTLEHTQLEMHLMVDYGSRPLVLLDDNGDRLGSLVGSLTTINAMAAVGLFDIVDIGIVIPLVSATSGDLDGVPGLLEESNFTLGDIRLVPRVTLYNGRRDGGAGAALALAANVWLPTGNEDAYTGGQFLAEPKLAFDYTTASGLRVATNLGYLFRPSRQVDNLEVTSALTYGLSLALPATEWFHIIPELFGSAGVSANDTSREETPLEALLGLRFLPGDMVVQAGGGMGLINGFGTPDWRIFLSVGYASPATPPEPEPDCRVETIATDCPDVPQSTCANGVIRTYTAACTDGTCSYPVLETHCNDGMMCGGEPGAPVCVPEPDCTNHGDCDNVPPTTCVDNTVTFYVGRCEGGECVYQPSEVACGEDMECGLDGGVPACVERRVVRVDEVTQRIELEETVFFATDSAVIESRSFALLTQVAEILDENPQITLIRIEGHTDSVGSRRYNVSLSQQRADSVRDFLVGRGIAESRIVTQGFGPERPIDDNSTEAGRAANRRVEIHIVSQEITP